MISPVLRATLLVSAMTVVVVLCVSPARSEAQEVVGSTDSCLATTDATWSEQEAWVWAEICNRRRANLAAINGAPEDPADPESWPDGTELRSEYLEAILLDEPYVSALATRPVRINGAHIVGDVDLSLSTVPRSLGVSGSLFEGEVSLLDSTVLGRVHLSGSTIGGELELNGASVDGSVFLASGGSYQHVDLIGTSISGSVVASGSAFDGELDLSGATVGGTIFLRDGGSYQRVDLSKTNIGGDVSAGESTFQDELDLSAANLHGWVNINDGTYQRVDIKYASIAGSINAGGSTFNDELDLRTSSVGGEIFLNHGSSYQRVDLVNTTIEGDVYASESTFRDELNLHGATVQGSVLLRDGGSYQGIELTNATIDGNVLAYGSAFDSKLDLRSARVAGSLILAFGSDAEDMPNWGDDANLDLSGADVGFIDDSPDAWPRTIRLDGFTYTHPTGLAHQPGQSFIDRDVEWYLGWLDGTASSSEVFARQPYLHLEQHLRDAGRGDVADEVAMARLDRERQGRAGLWAWWGAIDAGVIGYGYRPTRALLVAALFWLIGSLVVWIERPFRQATGVRPMVFSLDRLIPLVTFSKVNHDADISTMRRLGRFYFYFHMAVGYVLGLLIIAAITRITTT